MTKTAVSGAFGVFMTAMAGAGGAGAVAVSTADIKTDFDAAEVLAQELGLSSDKAVQDYIFDGNALGGIGNPGRASAVPLNITLEPSAKTAVTQPKPAANKAKAPPPLSEPKRLGEIVDESKGTLVVSNGSMYRIARTAPAWQFWDSGKVIEKSVPNADGAVWDKKGEFVGEWEKVVKTDADRFQVGKAADGREHVYTTYKNATVFLLSNEETKAEFERTFPDPESRPWYYRKFGAVPRGWVNGEEVYVNAEGVYIDKRDYNLLLEHEVGHISGRDHENFGVMSDNGVVRSLTTFPADGD